MHLLLWPIYIFQKQFLNILLISFFSLNLNEIHNLLFDDDFGTLVSIEPPIEGANADTDCDSDESDDEVTWNPDHLPARILSANVLIEDELLDDTALDEKKLNILCHYLIPK